MERNEKLETKKRRNKPELSISASSSSNSLSLASAERKTEEIIFPAPETSPEIHFFLFPLGDAESFAGGVDPSPRPLKKDAMREREREGAEMEIRKFRGVKKVETCKCLFEIMNEEIKSPKVTQILILDQDRQICYCTNIKDTGFR